MLSLVRIYLFVYGALTIAGGAIGFVKAKSRASLIAGGISGALLLVAAYLVGTENARAGLLLMAVVSVALEGRFLPSFRRTRKFMPAGLMTILAALGIVFSLIALVGT